eukprot:CAMPEP_0115676518 /NCGR_PEP_ID=MMETSP0272-20121206/54735_1 /TAXON_ID=71861 /ORGANISM="Scrippsiella trochoidea, Strain CCMP3099" /LENGTH=72 /DNA_ID=CAMNT_0003115575 /DNA_START=376 /DNA_END=594 /DNA_ORIENTATION=+
MCLTDEWAAFRGQPAASADISGTSIAEFVGHVMAYDFPLENEEQRRQRAKLFDETNERNLETPLRPHLDEER